MSLTRLLFVALATTLIRSNTDDMLAEISFYDLGGKIHTLTLPYLIKPQKVQYGVKFGIMAYYIDVIDCRIVVGDDMVEYFAAYIVPPPECSPMDIVKDAIAHGADFVFVDVIKLDHYDSLIGKNFDIPVLPIDKTHDDVFKLSEVEYDRRYIHIEFLMVS